jgi:hypothetical protein
MSARVPPLPLRAGFISDRTKAALATADENAASSENEILLAPRAP